MIETIAPLAEMIAKYGAGIILGALGVCWGLMQRADNARAEVRREAERAQWVTERAELHGRIERISERYAAAMGPLTQQLGTVAGFINSLTVTIGGVMGNRS